MKLIHKILKNLHIIFGSIIGLILFYFGRNRILLGISSIKTLQPVDYGLIHFMNLGLLYIDLSIVVLISFIIIIIIFYKK